jgi:predicted DNA-binding transcriptional regulator YafY
MARPRPARSNPSVLVGSGEAWYLVGYCRLRGDQRVFRLDRIATARLAEEQAPDRGEPSFDDVPAGFRSLSLLE